ncbi:MAG: RICIN domain-containing protein, partial [Ruminiclostridium sp.]|nr:RICIN domain-containing protein [Ruminiclostridium sp.]
MKKISKKILSLVTAFAMIFTIFASPIGEIMGFMGDSVKASAITTSEVQEKIEEIKTLFPQGSYFNANGSACSHSQSETCYNCMLYGVLYGNSKANGTAASALLSDQSYTSSYTCCAFARFVFYNIFGHKHTTNTTKISSSTYGGVNDSFMSQLKPGDYLECYKNGTLVHYAVFLYADTANDKYYIAEANYSKPSDVAYTKARSYSSYSSLVAYRSNSYTEASYSTIASATYFIKNTSTNTYLSVDSGTDANTQNISVASKSNTNAFKWKFTNTSGKAYKIRPLCSTSRLLNPYGSTVASGNNVNLYDDTDSTQWWYFETLDDGYVIRNYANSSCVLDISGTNVLVSTYVEGKQSQIWTLAPVDLVKPTITLDKSSYEVGDTVNISWAATPSSTNFSHYWLRVISPAGDNLVHKSMGNVNSYALTVTEEGTYTIIASTTPVGSPNGENSLVEGKTFEVGHEHTYTSKITKAATCTATGVRTYTCSKCGDSYTETIAKTGHDYTETVVEPTYTSLGYTYHYCENCGDEYEDEYVNKLSYSAPVYYGGTSTTVSTDTGVDGSMIVIRNSALGVIEEEDIALKPTDIIYAHVYPEDSSTDTSGWSVALNSFDVTWNGWNAVVSDNGVLELSCQVSDVMEVIGCDDISTFGGFILQVWGTEADVSIEWYLDIVEAPTVSALSGFGVKSRNYNSITLNWAQNSTASGYIIQQYKNNTWTNIANIKS